MPNCKSQKKKKKLKKKKLEQFTTSWIYL